MHRPFFGRVLLFASFFFTFTVVSHAQGGSCKDPWINAAYNADFHRAPSGSGTSGECNINLYGAGSWSSEQDLFIRVTESKDCTDPWIGQIYRNLYNRKPTAAECSVSNYGGGQWSTYMDLTAKIQAYQSGGGRASSPVLSSGPCGSYRAPNARSYVADAGLDLCDSNGNVVANAGSFFVQVAPSVVSHDGGSIVSHDGGSLVSHDGGSLISHDGGSLVGPSGAPLKLTPGSIISQDGSSYSVQSVGGKRVIAASAVALH
jgi:hypothetical protein